MLLCFFVVENTEFMGKKNVQNLISFYLNTEMYRKFAIKELRKNRGASNADLHGARQILSDFAKGLIHSYLLNAINFTATNNDNVSTLFNFCLTQNLRV